MFWNHLYSSFTRTPSPEQVNVAFVAGTEAHTLTHESEVKWRTNSWGAEKKGEWLVSIDRMSRHGMAVYILF